MTNPKIHPQDISIRDQVACVGRELGMRKRCYPKWVSSERMTQKEADQEIAAMEAVYKTMREVADKNQLKLFES